MRRGFECATVIDTDDCGQWVRGRRRVDICLAVILITALCLPLLATAQTTVYVDADAGGSNNGTDWPNAYTALQDALDEVNTNSATDYEIWIADGVYYPDIDNVPANGTHTPGDRTESFTLTRDGIEIYGGFVGGEGALSERDVRGNPPAVLSGDIDNNDTTDARSVTRSTNDIQGSNARRVVYLLGKTNKITTDTRVDGLTVTGGQATGNGRYQNSGGGIYCDGFGADSECSALLVNLVVRGNYADEDGAGIFMISRYGGTNDTAIINTYFAGNKTNLGFANRGGALYIDGAFEGNSQVKIINSIFTGNQANDGAAINLDGRYDGSVETEIGTSIFFDNTAADDGGAIFTHAIDNGTSDVGVTNTIFLDNSGGDGPNDIYESAGTSTAMYSLFGAGCPSATICGPNVIEQVAEFFDADEPRGADGVIATRDDGLHLSADSPALNQGDTSALPNDLADLDGDGNTTEALPLDLAGTSRVQGAAVNMGAYEGLAAFTVGGTVSGLAAGNSVTLSNNAADALTASTNSGFTFDVLIENGMAYDVTVTTQPSDPNQTCNVANGSGTVSGAAVDDISVSCTTEQYTVAGTVSGLEGSGLTLQLAGGGTISVDENGSFAFLTPLEDGSDYQVTIAEQPSGSGQTCTLADGSGTIMGGNLDIQVNCQSSQGSGGDGGSGGDADHGGEAGEQPATRSVPSLNQWGLLGLMLALLATGAAMRPRARA